jgi:signal transduction histidine kinase
MERINQNDEGLERMELRNIPAEVLHDLVDIQERDRRLVAYEIHDGLAQQLTGTLYSFQIFQQLRGRSPEEAEKAFDRGMELLAESLAESRRLINGLRPPILDDHGIVDAIDYLVCEAGKHGKLTIEFDADFPRIRLIPNLENTLFRIVQESLTNIRKHSQSPRADVALRRDDSHILVSVRDRGVGFDPLHVAHDRFGLRGIRDRAALVGGRAEIRSTPGGGTEVFAELPYHPR